MCRIQKSLKHILFYFQIQLWSKPRHPKSPPPASVQRCEDCECLRPTRLSATFATCSKSTRPAWISSPATSIESSRRAAPPNSPKSQPRLPHPASARTVATRAPSTASPRLRPKSKTFTFKLRRPLYTYLYAWYKTVHIPKPFMCSSSSSSLLFFWYCRFVKRSFIFVGQIANSIVGAQDYYCTLSIPRNVRIVCY